MNVDEYQLWAKSTAVYEHDFYPMASLMIEAAEFADLFAKPQLRGDDKTVPVREIISEAGDIMWNLANALHDMGITLSEVMEYNRDKIESRKQRGVIMGDGGDR